MVNYISQGLIFIILFTLLSCRGGTDVKSTGRSIASYISSDKGQELRSITGLESKQWSDVCFFLKTRNTYLANVIDGKQFKFVEENLSCDGSRYSKDKILTMNWTPQGSGYFENSSDIVFEESNFSGSILEKYCEMVIENDYEENFVEGDINYIFTVLSSGNKRSFSINAYGDEGAIFSKEYTFQGELLIKYSKKMYECLDDHHAYSHHQWKKLK